MNNVNRRWNKAQKELNETKVLVEYLIHFHRSFDNIANFQDSVVKDAVLWYRGQQKGFRDA